MILPFYQLIMLIAAFVILAAYIDRKLQKEETVRFAKRPLSFDESYVLACLLQVSTATIYGESIRRNLEELEDVEQLRLQIREVCQSLREEPDAMRSILGDQVYEAVSEYMDKHPFLISKSPVVPGGGHS